jgi:hypothetical protein
MGSDTECPPPKEALIWLAIPAVRSIVPRMGMRVFPDWVQSQRLVSEVAEQLGDSLSEAGAKSILKLKIRSLRPARRRKLADKANEGLLTMEEFAAYETYAQVRGLVALLQSKARLRLKRPKAQ